MVKQITIKNKDMVFKHGQMVQDIKVIGMKIKQMEKV